MIWKITDSLSNPSDPDWESLLKLSIPGAVHENRKRGFFLAREALRLGLSSLGHSPSISELTFTNFSSVKGFANYTVSLSHTGNWGAAVIGEKEIYRSVGIDIELQTRPISPAIREKISHPQDTTLRDIEFWCIKEATFKALMNTGLFSQHQKFSDILIQKGTWTHIPSQISGKFEVKTINPLVLALAWIPV